MRNVLIVILFVTGIIVASGVVVFRFTLGLTWLDAAYFVVATITTVGYGDINLQQAPPSAKIFGTLLMIAGAASMASMFGIITDFILRSRLEEFLTPRRRPMRNHVVLCGLGNVGFRVLEYLHKLGEAVVVVEKREQSQFLDQARAMKVPVVIGDIRFDSVLKEVNIQQAKCLIAATNDDLANLDVALSAREARSDIRIVLRMFDQSLAKKIRGAFDIQTAFSTSALAAPVFAMAALDPSVIGSFFVGSDLMLNVEVDVSRGARLDGMTAAQLAEQGDLTVLAHTAAETGQRRLHPGGGQSIHAGDTLVVATTPECLERLQGLNAPA